jgi:antibiotic biosynthesis monooxygenase (ABM) superfamily enzyme
MITRIWHGYTTPENADAYEQLLKNKIFPYIAEKKVAGYRQIQLLKRPLGDEIEFITIMKFDSMNDVVAFAGEDYETAFVLPEADALLKRYDPKSQHYQLLQSLSY